MSTNPYAAPKAQVADETVVLRDNFIPEGRVVSPANGLFWIASGWSIFRAEAGIWIAMALLFGVIFVVLSMLPFVGPVVLSLVLPVFVAGFVVTSRTIDLGGDARFEQLFAGFKHRLGSLVVVGLISLAISFAITVIVLAITGVSFATLATPPTDPAAAAQFAITMVLASLIILALTLPVVMATWFAPALIVFHELAPIEAMKVSFLGCLKNVLAFLLYGLILLLPAIVATLPILLGWLVLGPIVAGSVYAAYRDIYFADEASAG